MKLLSDNTDPWNNYAGYTPTYDDEWFEGMGEDDWIYGEGSRFGDDDFGNDPFTNEWAEEGWDMEDDGFGTPTEMKEAIHLGEEIVRSKSDKAAMLRRHIERDLGSVQYA